MEDSKYNIKVSKDNVDLYISSEDYEKIRKWQQEYVTTISGSISEYTVTETLHPHSSEEIILDSMKTTAES